MNCPAVVDALTHVVFPRCTIFIGTRFDQVNRTNRND